MAAEEKRGIFSEVSHHLGGIFRHLKHGLAGKVQIPRLKPEVFGDQYFTVRFELDFRAVGQPVNHQTVGVFVA